MIKKDLFEIYNLKNNSSSRFSIIYHAECVNVIEDLNTILLITNGRGPFLRDRKRLVLLELDCVSNQYKVKKTLGRLSNKLNALVACKNESLTKRGSFNSGVFHYINGAFIEGSLLSYFIYCIDEHEFQIKHIIEVPENLKLLQIVNNTVFGTCEGYLMLWLFKVLNGEWSVIRTQLILNNQNSLINIHGYLTFFCFVTQKNIRLLTQENASTFWIVSTNTNCYKSFVQKERLVLFCQHGIDIYSGETLQWIKNIHLYANHFEAKKIFSNCFIFQNYISALVLNEETIHNKDERIPRSLTSVSGLKTARKIFVWKS